jgi:hypothetical protein
MTNPLAASAAVPYVIGDALRRAALFVPKFVLFVVILVIGWLVARLLLRAVDGVLERVGFDRWVERGGIKTALARSRYDASDIVAKLVYYAVLLFTLQLAFGVWGPNPVSALIGGIVAWLPRAFVAVIIVVVASAIGGAVRDIISGALGGLTYGRVLANVASWFIIAIGVIAALNQIGVATTVTTPILVAVLATIAGILIVGVGGGLVRPMQNRLDRWLDRITAESAAIGEHAKAYSAGRRDTDERLAAERAGQPQAGEPHPAEPARAGAQPRGYPPGTSAAGSRPPEPTGGLRREPQTGDDATRIVPPTNPPRDDIR